MAIPALELVRAFQRMWNENWTYVWGGASKGKVDCSGAFVFALRQYGVKIYHSSNWLARYQVERLIPIGEALANGLIVPGMAAFRSRVPGQAKYSLNGKYKPGGKYDTGDLTGYYHVGLVDEDVRFVLNAAGTAKDFERHPINENWSHVAKLIGVDYDTPYEEDTTMIDVHETLHKGAKGTAVVRMQGLLRQHGFDIEADGAFGAKTAEALKAFQKSKGLAADGVCGPLTWAALQEGVDDVELLPEDEPAGKLWQQMTVEERTDWLFEAVRLLTDGVISVNGTLVLSDGHIADRIIAVAGGGDTDGS